MKPKSWFWKRGGQQRRGRRESYVKVTPGSPSEKRNQSSVHPQVKAKWNIPVSLKVAFGKTQLPCFICAVFVFTAS